MDFWNVDYRAVVLAGAAGWLVGAVWYGIFGRAWLSALGKTKDELKGPSGRPRLAPFVWSFVLELIMAWVLAVFIAKLGPATVRTGLMTALYAWLGFVATSIGVNDGFAQRSCKLTSIDSGHWLAVLLVQGAVIGTLAGF